MPASELDATALCGMWQDSDQYRAAFGLPLASATAPSPGHGTGLNFATLALSCASEIINSSTGLFAPSDMREPRIFDGGVFVVVGTDDVCRSPERIWRIKQ
jgi:hypothetical protein